MKARTTAVIVTYRSRGVVDRALDALTPIHAAGGIECIVVDNASDDGTADHVRARYPWVVTLAGPTNLGFGRGCNAGLARAHTENVLFLNPDAVVDGTALRMLERFLDERPEAGLVAPAVAFEDGGYQPVRPLPTPFGIVASESGLDAGGPTPVWPGGEPFPTDWLCGAVLMGRREVLDRLGGFDPRFFMYFEETDLCVRARSSNVELWMVPRAVARHTSGASARASDASLWSGCIAEHYFASRHYYLAKHFGLLPACAATCLELAVMAGRAAAGLLRGRSPDRLLARVKAPIVRMPRAVGG